MHRVLFYCRLFRLYQQLLVDTSDTSTSILRGSFLCSGIGVVSWIRANHNIGDPQAFGPSDAYMHWGQVTHICVFNITIIGSDNGLSPGRRQAIIRTNAGILLIGPLGTNFSEIIIGIQAFSFKKMHVKMSSAKWRPFCLGLNVLRYSKYNILKIQRLSWQGLDDKMPKQTIFRSSVLKVGATAWIRAVM